MKLNCVPVIVAMVSISANATGKLGKCLITLSPSSLIVKRFENHWGIVELNELKRATESQVLIRDSKAQSTVLAELLRAMDEALTARRFEREKNPVDSTMTILVRAGADRANKLNEFTLSASHERTLRQLIDLLAGRSRAPKTEIDHFSLIRELINQDPNDRLVDILDCSYVAPIEKDKALAGIEITRSWASISEYHRFLNLLVQVPGFSRKALEKGTITITGNVDGRASGKLNFIFRSGDEDSGLTVALQAAGTEGFSPLVLRERYWRQMQVFQGRSGGGLRVFGIRLRQGGRNKHLAFFLDSKGELVSIRVQSDKGDAAFNFADLGSANMATELAKGKMISEMAQVVAEAAGFRSDKNIKRGAKWGLPVHTLDDSRAGEVSEIYFEILEAAYNAVLGQGRPRNPNMDRLVRAATVILDRAGEDAKNTEDDGDDEVMINGYELRLRKLVDALNGQTDVTSQFLLNFERLALMISTEPRLTVRKALFAGMGRSLESEMTDERIKVTETFSGNEGAGYFLDQINKVPGLGHLTKGVVKLRGRSKPTGDRDWEPDKYVVEIQPKTGRAKEAGLRIALRSLESGKEERGFPFLIMAKSSELAESFSGVTSGGGYRVLGIRLRQDGLNQAMEIYYDDKAVVAVNVMSSKEFVRRRLDRIEVQPD